METEPRYLQHLRKIPQSGIICSLLSGLSMAISNILNVVVVKNDNIFYVTFLGFACGTAILLPTVLASKNNPFGISGERLLLLAYTIFAGIAQVLSTYVLLFISATDATTVFMTSAIMVVFLAPCILKEAFKKVYVLAAILGLGGVILIDRPTFMFPSDDNGSGGNRMLGVVLALVTAALMAAFSLVNRKMLKTNVCVFQLTMCIVATVESVAAMQALGEKYFLLRVADYAIAIASGLFSVVSTFWLALALQLAEAGPVSIVGLVQVPVIMVLEIIFVKWVPKWTTYCGTVLVLIGAILTFIQMWDKGREKIKLIVQNLCARTVQPLKAPFLKTVSYRVQTEEKSANTFSDSSHALY